MQDTNIQTFVKSRILLGWLNNIEGPLWLAGRDQSKITPDFIQKSQDCINFVLGRQNILNIETPISELPYELQNFVEEFWKQPDAEVFKLEQWSIVMADLTKICAAQPNVSTQQAKERLAGVNLNNITEVASITLPKTKETAIPINFDTAKNAWIVSSPNPNLRVSANFNAPIGQGITGLGFGISLSNSFLQVAECNGRFILRDGYHRAIGLLSEGITKVPVLTKKFNTYTEMAMPVGLLPPEIIFGNNPPFLSDYLDDNVSTDATTPIIQKIIIIQGLELTTLG